MTDTVIQADQPISVGRAPTKHIVIVSSRVSALGVAIRPPITPRIITDLPRAGGAKGIPGMQYIVMESRHAQGTPFVQRTMIKETAQCDGEEGRREGQEGVAVQGAEGYCRGEGCQKEATVDTEKEEEEETEKQWRLERLQREKFVARNVRDKTVCTIYRVGQKK